MTAYFTPSDGALVPHPDARAPWSADMLHGRLLAGLAAWAIERDHGDPEFVPARLTVDLYRSPAMAPTSIGTALVRGGGRVRVADASVTVGGQDVARASSVWLRRSSESADEAQIPSTGAWDAPPPGGDDDWPAVEGVWDIRPIANSGFGAPGPDPRRVWLRDGIRLVDGTDLTPFVRVALCADFASPLANSAADALEYINADLTLHIARLPVGEWIGVETDDRVAADGVSVAQCRYHDAQGPVGFSTVCAVRTTRMPTA